MTMFRRYLSSFDSEEIAPERIAERAIYISTYIMPRYTGQASSHTKSLR